MEFHAGRHSAALNLFNQAVQSDENDAYARYYRAVTEGKLRDFDAAITDLRAVIAKRPDISQAYLELGMALVQKEAFADAILPLKQAQFVADLEAQASLFLGLAQLRLGQTDEAQRNFARAAARDPKLELPSRYYQGLTHYQQGRWKRAEDDFRFVANAKPDSEMGREAAAFLSKMQQGLQPSHQLYLAMGFQYDSNVLLAPADAAAKGDLRISNQSDGRATLNAGGVYVPWRAEHAQLSLGYDFYQSLHFELTEFDLQDHRPSIQLMANAGIFQLGIEGRYDYYLLDTDSFLQEASAFPWLTIRESNLGQTQLFYRMRRRDFLQQVFSIRNAFNHAAGIRQVFYLNSPDRWVSVGYRFDREDPIRDSIESNQFAYDGNEINAGLGLPLPYGVTGEATYAYRHERYAVQSNGRRDDEHEFIIALHRRLTEYVGVTCALYASRNKSNNLLFDYNRQIGSIALEVRY